MGKNEKKKTSAIGRAVLSPDFEFVAARENMKSAIRYGVESYIKSRRLEAASSEVAMMRRRDMTFAYLTAFLEALRLVGGHKDKEQIVERLMSEEKQRARTLKFAMPELATRIEQAIEPAADRGGYGLSEMVAQSTQARDAVRDLLDPIYWTDEDG